MKETQKVWKYPVTLTDFFTIRMPAGAEILSVQSQYGEPQIWVLVDQTREFAPRHFRMAGTGHPIREENPQFIGTFQMQGGSFVGHLFEVTPHG